MNNISKLNRQLQKAYRGTSHLHSNKPDDAKNFLCETASNITMGLADRKKKYFMYPRKKPHGSHTGSKFIGEV